MSKEKHQSSGARETLLRLETSVDRSTDLLRRLRAECGELRAENTRLQQEARELRQRLAAMGRAMGNREEGRKLRQLERKRRQLRGKVMDLLRLAEELSENVPRAEARR
jgi:regulator of replication initiation timing